MKGHAVKFPQRLYHLTLCFRTLAQVEGRAEVCSRQPANKGPINRKPLHLLKMFIRWMQEQRRLNSLQFSSQLHDHGKSQMFVHLKERHSRLP